MEKKKPDMLTIVIRSIICGAIVTIGVWRVGYGMAFGPDMSQSVENLLSIIIMSVLFFSAMVLPKVLLAKTKKRVIFHLAAAVCYSLVVTAALFAFGMFVPQWAAAADGVEVLPMYRQMFACFGPLTLIWFAANVMGDKMKGRKDEEDSDE